MVSIRENWRVVLLVFVLVGSTIALFPMFGVVDRTGGNTGAATEGMTNLQYGLELSGGTRIRAPLVGVTAEEVEIGDADTRDVVQEVAGEVQGADPGDVIVRRTAQTTATVEVTADNVTTQELGSALDSLDYSYGTVREGVTDPTRQEVVRVLQNKINEAGLSGGTVQQVTTATGGHFVLVEVPNEDRSEVVDLVESRGSVRIDIYYRQNGSYTTREGVLTGEDFQNIGTAQESERGPFVPVTVRDQAAEDFQQAVVETGVAQPGGATCTYEASPETTEPCLLVVVDDQVVNAFGMSPGLAQSMQAGSWADDPAFQLTTQNFSEAQTVSINLRAGELPARLNLEGEDGGTSSFISPSQGENFKTNSVITGIIAVFAVAIVVFIRYGEAKVALPMIVTAFSEVLILLGFAAGIGYALNLPAIAGFIAVIGTGVDDLIIIADEVMAEGEVSSRRVFQSRFRKAFWVIGAAAATTVIAMSPLAVLSLGDLQGFAIFTILGVLVGVLLTRPAYGDILRMLLTDR
jgi:preprotein translocase subunit SecD